MVHFHYCPPGAASVIRVSTSSCTVMTREYGCGMYGQCRRESQSTRRNQAHFGPIILSGFGAASSFACTTGCKPPPIHPAQTNRAIESLSLFHVEHFANQSRAQIVPRGTKAVPADQEKHRAEQFSKRSQSPSKIAKVFHREAVFTRRLVLSAILSGNPSHSVVSAILQLCGSGGFPQLCLVLHNAIPCT
jgi:hypothetical protein